MLHLLRVCFCAPLTSPWWITLSLNTYSTFPLAEIFSACNQKRTLPFSSSSTASSVFRGMTGEEGWKSFENINSVLNNIHCFGDLWQDGSCTEPWYICFVFVLKRNVVTRHDAIDKLASKFEHAITSLRHICKCHTSGLFVVFSSLMCPWPSFPSCLIVSFCSPVFY